MELARKQSRRGRRSSEGTKKSKTPPRKRWTFDVDSAADEISRILVERWGLDVSGVTPDFIRDIVADIVGGIVENRATKPTIESLVKNLERNKRMVLKAIAAKLVALEDLSVEQLEFILAYAPEIAGKAAPHLYRIAKEKGADHVIEALRVLWVQYGTPTRIECPYCGFNSVTPGLYCMVCGREVRESDLKEKIGFRGLLEMFASTAPLSLVQEILSSGFVLYDGEIKPPSMRPQSPGAVELFLTSEEKKLVSRIIEERLKGGSRN